jgi:predicted DNA binding CopG/RHH family protein
MTYLLRDVDPGLWQRVKVRAAKDGVPIRTLILKLLRTYLSGRA